MRCPRTRSARARLARSTFRCAAAVVAFAAVVAARPARAPAAAIFQFVEVSGDVVGTLSGSLNVSGVHFSTPSYDPRVYPQGGAVVATPGDVNNGITADIYQTISGPAAFGAGSVTEGVATGGAFEVAGDRLVVPAGYSGQALSNTLTFSGQTLASMGVNPGSYVYTLTGSGDTVTVTFVPEPAALGVLALGGPLLLARRRRRHPHCRPA